MRYSQAAAAIVLAACGGEGGGAVDAGREREVVVEVAGQPAAVLYQDGDGAWQLAEQLDALRYGFDLDGERYGVVAVCSSAESARGVVLYATTRDVDPTLDVGCVPIGTVAEATITGELSGLTGARGISVHSRGFGITEAVELDHSPVVPYEIAAQTGPQTIVFARLGFGGLPDMFAIRRDVAIAGARTIDVAFDREGALVAEPLTFSATSPDGAPSTVEARFVAGGTAIALGSPQLNFGTFARPPKEIWRAGDRTELVATTDGLEPGDLRRAIVTAYAYDELVDVVELPPSLTTATLGFEMGEPVLYWSDYTGVERWTATVFDLVRAPTPVWQVNVTRSWLSPTAASNRAPIPGERALAPLGVWDEQLRIVAGRRWRIDGALARGRWQATVGRTGMVE